MTLIVKVITRLTIGLILLYGIYITLHGHSGPGGGFAGGVILALSFIHILLAFGKEAALKNVTERAVILAMSLGGVVFLSTATWNFMSSHPLKEYILSQESFRMFSSGVVALHDLAVCLLTGSALFVIFLALAFFNPKEQKD